MRCGFGESGYLEKAGGSTIKFPHKGSLKPFWCLLDALRGSDYLFWKVLACGCPVIASDIVPHREIYQKLTANSIQHTVIEQSAVSSKQFADKLEAVALVKPNDAVE